jgi:hypothetical protein
MADETPPEAQAATPKKETVRITLPPKPADSPLVKRETVRIQPPGTAPKSDSARLPGLGAVPPAPPSAPKPFVPPSAPRPPGTPGAPSIPTRPGAPGASMPKPPGPPPAPPARPAPPAAPGAAPKAAAYAEAAPVAMKAAAPKKETARISLPPESKPMPKATIKLQQTQPLAQAPAPSIRTAPATQVGATAAGESDAATGILSWIVFVLSLAACVLGYMAYSA